MTKTPYQIAAETDHLSDWANTRAINAAFRAQDESHLWPIRNRFNATERAIRRTRKMYSDCGEPCVGLAYALNIDAELSAIVNSDI